MERTRLFLKPGREKSIRNRHPWVFDGAIERAEAAAGGGLGDLYDSRGALVASGFFSPHSQIRLRALTFGEPLTLEEIALRIGSAIARRAGIEAGGTNAYRLIHAEGDELSGLIVDRYDDALVVEITSAGLEVFADFVASTLREATGIESIYFKNDLPARRIERIVSPDRVLGDAGRQRVIIENGLRFRVEPGKGQKTGFFLDQRENRALVRELAGGSDVLNLFSYTGGFGVYAAAGGARSVDEVDISEAAIDLAQQNHELNPTESDVKLTMADAFDQTRELVRQSASFDIVVCDPPPFARSRGEVERAARGYKDINMQAFRLTRPGGHLMTFSCSGHVDLDLFQKVVFSAALDSGRSARILARLGAGPDHPVSIYCPEGEYLKGFLLQVG